MGIASWIASGVVAFVIARIVPPGRSSRWLAELAASLLMAIALGLTATALDFGGWREPEPRAALLIVCGSFAAIGLLRLLRLARRKHAAW